jgi:PhzF family phenazine biosynthesis protein
MHITKGTRMPTPLYTVDAFTAVPFAGNPAAVCPLDGPRDAVWMQQVALEMNLSETAFLWRQGDLWSLRWFTPVVEVDLCGHATLASAHTLWTHGYVDPSAPIRFTTRSGVLTATLADGWITLDFPNEAPHQIEPFAQLIDALGFVPSWVGQNRMDIMVVAESEAFVTTYAPDFTTLGALDTRGIIVTAPSSTPGIDFVSRWFGANAGLGEDPVTGSAHCCLAPYWGALLGKTALVGAQRSPRGGIVRTELVGDRVKLIGQAVTIMQAQLFV